MINQALNIDFTKPLDLPESRPCVNHGCNETMRLIDLSSSNLKMFEYQCSNCIQGHIRCSQGTGFGFSYVNADLVILNKSDKFKGDDKS